MLEGTLPWLDWFGRVFELDITCAGTSAGSSIGRSAGSSAMNALLDSAWLLIGAVDVVGFNVETVGKGAATEADTCDA